MNFSHLCDYLSDAFTIVQKISIIEVGPRNFLGYARCVYSDGSERKSFRPALGQTLAIRHTPLILLLSKKDAVQITPWNKQPFELPTSKIYEMTQDYMKISSQ